MQQNCQEERLRIPGIHSKTGVRLCEDFHVEAEEPQPTESRDDIEARRDFWSIQGDFIHRHHIESRVQLHVPKEETLPIPLKYVDVMRSTHTDLDAAQEKRTDDYWIVDEDRKLSDS